MVQTSKVVGGQVAVLDWLSTLKARKTEFKWRNPQYGRIIMENMALKHECGLNGAFSDKTKTLQASSTQLKGLKIGPQ
jgi:hypothetical protein